MLNPVSHTLMRGFIPPESSEYLQAPVAHAGLAALLLSVAVYGIATDAHPYPYAGYVALLAAAILLAFLLQRPRWIVYGLLLTALCIRVIAFVHIVANRAQDKVSTRDAAVEMTAQALMRGENAWNVDLGVEVTTGPTSILLALPFVSLFGQINWLSFLFWAVLLGVLLGLDTYYRNNSWPTLALMILLGLFDIEHTMYWSLEELYYPVLYLALAYLLTTRERWGWAGALLAASILSRPSYCFLVLGLQL